MVAQVSGVAARKDAAVGLVRILTEAQGIIGQPASWAKLLATCVSLCEAEPREGGSSGGAAAAGAVAPGGGAAATPYADQADEAEDCFDSALSGGGVGGVSGAAGEEYSAAFSRLAFASSKDRSAFPHIPDAKRWFVDALARLGGRFPGRVPALVDASPVAATVRSYAAAAGIAIP